MRVVFQYFPHISFVVLAAYCDHDALFVEGRNLLLEVLEHGSTSRVGPQLDTGQTVFTDYATPQCIVAVENEQFLREAESSTHKACDPARIEVQKHWAKRGLRGAPEASVDELSVAQIRDQSRPVADHNSVRMAGRKILKGGIEAIDFLLPATLLFIQNDIDWRDKCIGNNQ